jgi:hypothetical protein
MHFSNGIIAPLIIEPLRYYFSTAAKTSNLIWDADEKKRTVEIVESFDENRIPIQQKPRIIVTRGGYEISKTGLSDNLAESGTIGDTKGLKDVRNLLFYDGQAQITIEARNKGTCELLADMVSHFIAWTRPALCDSQGFNEFGLPMRVGDCTMLVDEDPQISKYQVQISFPWRKEELWHVRNDGVIMKKILNSVTRAV